MTFRTLIGICTFCSLALAQQATLDWQQQVRKCAQEKDWNGAMLIVDREISRQPQDMDIRAWRARILAWSGRLQDAEKEYQEILTHPPQDPDNWMGLANVYFLEGKSEDGQKALASALELDPKRPDIRIAQARAFQRANNSAEARLEFQRVLALDPQNEEARLGLLALRGAAKHELVVGTETDYFSFADANHYEGFSLASRWTSRWTTTAAARFYARGGTNAESFIGGATRKIPHSGGLTVGGAAAHDNGVIPKSEAFFDYDQGLRTGGNSVIRGLEIDYGQHWYWYDTAQILTVNEMTLVYLPHTWTWALGFTGARTAFAGSESEWNPSGITRLTFPLIGEERPRLGGNLFFAVGTENFTSVDQIGHFSSHTFGGGLQLRLTDRQYLKATSGYQQRTQGRTQTSFDVSYGFHF
jgi:tetratricopeptide (TPR) repeat protein